MRKEFKYENHKIYAAIGYMVVTASYIERCIEEFYERISNVSNVKKPISTVLIELVDAVHDDSCRIGETICETLKFFEERNKFIHGQFIGSRNINELKITHKRKNIYKAMTSVEEIEKLISTGKKLLNTWQAISISRLQ